MTLLVFSNALLASATLAQPLTHIDPETVIPLRIIQPYNCDVSASPHPRCRSIDQFRATVARGNRTWQEAGVRFWIKSLEYYDLPLTRQRDHENEYTWSQVRGELQQIFPAMPANAYGDNEVKVGHHWLMAATAFFGDPTEALVILHEKVGNPYSTGQGPWGGKVVYLRWNHVGGTDVDAASTVLPHELGHFLGLTHLDGGPGSTFYNPSTGQPYTKCDFWDQTFAPGNPPTFFQYPWSTGCEGSTVSRIAPNVLTSYATSLSEPTLEIDGATFQPGDWQTQVIAAPTGLPHLPPQQWGYSLNLMTGWANAPGSAGPDGRVPRHVSESQIAIVHDFLNDEHPFIQKNIDLYVRSGGGPPVGATETDLTSHRPLLGKAKDDFLWWSNGALTGEFSFAKEARNLGPGYLPVVGNFDGAWGDDIYWYRPETGAATAWWSNGDGTFDTVRGYQHAPHARLFSGDFDGSGEDDLYFYVPGSAQDVIAYGTGNRQFWSGIKNVHATWEPFAADLDGDLDDDIVWFDPLADSAVIWWSDAETLPANAVGTDFTTEAGIQIGGPGAEHCRRPIVGDFDNAWGDDVFWYCAGPGTERIWKSNGTKTPTKLSPANVAGFYRPFGGDFDGDGYDDIFWDALSPASDAIWAGAPDAPQVPHVVRTDIHGFFKALAGDFDGDSDTDIFWYRDAAERWVEDYGYSASAGSWRLDEHPRLMADVNNDGRQDIVGFGFTGTYVSLSSGDGFTPAAKWSSSFGDNGWDWDRHPRLVGDVDGDGKEDVVGFGHSGVYVARSTGTGFLTLSKWGDGYGYSNGWRVDRHPRMLADVNNDGRMDVVGFANPGVYVSLSTGTGFTPSKRWVSDFGYNGGWRTDRHPRHLADVTGDGRADIVGFGNGGVWVAISTGSKFLAATEWLGEFGYNAGGWRVGLHPRFVTDVTGDGRADIVGLDPVFDQELLVSVSTGLGFTSSSPWIDLGEDLDYTYPAKTLAMADINGDGRSDAVAFGVYEDTFLALSTGSAFTKAYPWIDEYTFGTWDVDEHLRTLADVDGDGRADIVGFGGSGVWVWKADFCYAGDGS